jgi:Na+/H+ antiporter NhaD/arsenite permease-like protein
LATFLPIQSAHKQFQATLIANASVSYVDNWIWNANGVNASGNVQTVGNTANVTLLSTTETHTTWIPESAWGAYWTRYENDANVTFPTGWGNVTSS